MDEPKPRRDPKHLTGPNLLRAAKKILVDRGWGQGPVHKRETKTCVCAGEACQAVWKGGGPISPMKALASAIDAKFKPNDFGGRQVSIVLNWNDAPERTLEEVYAMFDRAAEIADEAEKNYVPL